MTPQSLKSAILQLAIQGKLVPQRPEEGVAEVPAAHKHRGKEARRHGEIEPPFDIPESWRWVRLGDVALIERGSGIKRSETSPTGVPCVRYGEIYTTYGYTFTSTKSFVPESVASSCHMANHGDVLCTLTGEWKEEIAKATAYLGKAPIAIGGDLAKISSTTFNPVLLVYFFFSPFMIEQKATSANGTMIVHIGKGAVENLLLPLPPLPEQHRIVAKIEELLPLVDRYEQAWTKLEDFNRRFPADMQKALLQMAIQGHLVDQRPEEGTGEQLYKKILSAKISPHLTSVVRGPSSKEKLLPPITEDEIPFEIPPSWKWVRFLSVVEIATNLVAPTEYASHRHIAPDNIEKGTGRLLPCKTVKEDKVASANHRFYKGQIIYSKIRPLLRKVVIAPFDGLCSADMYPLKTPMDSSFLVFYMLSDAFNVQIAQAMSSRVKMPKINQEELAKVLLPLPPLAEQKRIVAKLEELLPLCERLK